MKIGDRYTVEKLDDATGETVVLTFEVSNVEGNSVESILVSP